MSRVHDFWAGIQRPDLHVRLDKNLYTDLAVAGTGIPVYEENGVPATPAFTGDLNGSWTRHNGLYIADASQGRIDVAGQNYDGRYGTGCVFFTPNWNGNDGNKHTIMYNMPINTYAFSYIIIQKLANNVLDLSLRWASGAGNIKSANFAVNAVNFPAYTPCLLGWWWGNSTIGITLNLATYQSTGSVTMGDATVVTPMTSIGSGSVYSDEADGIISDFCLWKDRSRPITETGFWNAVYYRLKDMRGRKAA